jgi:hypothetical protein
VQKSGLLKKKWLTFHFLGGVSGANRCAHCVFVRASARKRWTWIIVFFCLLLYHRIGELFPGLRIDADASLLTLGFSSPHLRRSGNVGSMSNVHPYTGISHQCEGLCRRDACAPTRFSSGVLQAGRPRSDEQQINLQIQSANKFAHSKWFVDVARDRCFSEKPPQTFKFRRAQMKASSPEESTCTAA